MSSCTTRVAKVASEVLHLRLPVLVNGLCVHLARSGGWYDDDTYPKLLDMRQSCLIRRLQNRRQSLGGARIVLCRKDGTGKGTIPTEHSREGSTIPAKHTAKAEDLSPWRKRKPLLAQNLHYTHLPSAETPARRASTTQCLGCGRYPWRIRLAYHRELQCLIE
jgi:hypothetical protein